MGDRTEGIAPKLLHEIVSAAEKATAGKWRAVGKRVVSGESAIFDAVVPRHGLPENARLNAEYVASVSPGVLIALVNELFRLRRGIADAERQVEEAEARVEEMRQEMTRARAVAAAVTLPATAKAAATAARLADRIKQSAPALSRYVDDLAAIAKARAEVDDEP